MEQKICKTCEVSKPLNQYYSCKNCNGGLQGSCKMCILNKRVAKKRAEGKIHPFNKEFRKSEDAHFSMAGCTPRDYRDMWEILSLMGYDVWGDVHQQFLDKFNLYEKKPMKYQKRKRGFESYILPNGEVNPDSKSERYKKTPSK
jgi:hypothetical protein